MGLLFSTRRALIIEPFAAFYVDATDGNDANDGLSPDFAWQTIGKVNGETFNPDDHVLFKRGETWTGTTLVIPSSGALGHPITFGSYGAGALPTIDGNDTVHCIELVNQAYIRFENLYAFQGLDFGIYMHGNTNNFVLLDCQASDCGNDNVICIGNTVHSGLIVNLVSFDAYGRVGGPRISCLEIADGAHDIIVIDPDCSGSEDTGITIHSHPATDFPYNILISGASSHDNDVWGIIITQDNAILSVADANIQVVDSTFHDNASGGGTGAGIWITDTGDPYPTGISFDRCHAYSAFDRPMYCAGQATFTRCSFRADFQVRIENASDVVLTNCTMYRTTTIPFEIIGTTDGVVMRNCLLVSEGNTPISVVTTTNVDIDYTMYDAALNIQTNDVMRWGVPFYRWAAWLTNSGQDGNSPLPADPLFINPAINDFHLQAGSPARGVGIDLGFGTDLGAFQFGS